MSSEPVDVRFMTLNCWGIPDYPFYKSENKDARINAIVRKVLQGNYDVVNLQEIWCEDDYEKIKSAWKNILPFSRYFYSGWLGSGICVFSKFPIMDSIRLKFALNGIPYHLHKGDYYLGHSSGFVRIQLPNKLELHLYATYIHCQYDTDNDYYLSHRVSEAWELTKFINSNSKDADLVIVSGDLNVQPHDLGYKILRANASLHDAWLEDSSKTGNEGLTWGIKQNSFTDPNCSELKTKSEGQRLDYILYRHNQDTKIVEPEVNIQYDCIKNSEISLSDHQGVEAVFTLERVHPYSPRVEARISEKKLNKEKAVCIEEALDILEDREQGIKRDRIRFFLYLISTVTLLFASRPWDSDFVLVSISIFIVRMLVYLICSIWFWLIIGGLPMETKALKEIQTSLRDSLITLEASNIR